MRSNFYITLILALSTSLIAEVFSKSIQLPSVGIINGRKALPGQFPFMVSLNLIDSKGQMEHLCGASLITETHVLTAEHCLVSNKLKVIIGGYNVSDNSETRRQVLNVVKVFKVTDIAKYSRNNDIAILQLDSKVHLNHYDDKMGNVELMKLGFDISANNFTNENIIDVEPNSPVISLGYGNIDKKGRVPSQVLMFDDFKTIESSECQDAKHTDDERTMICVDMNTNHKSINSGDSGSPLLLNLSNNSEFPNYVQVGVASYLNLVKVGERFIEKNVVFTKVSFYADWIREILISSTVPTRSSIEL